MVGDGCRFEANAAKPARDLREDLRRPRLLPGLPTGGRGVRERAGSEAAGGGVFPSKWMPLFLPAGIRSDLPLMDLGAHVIQGLFPALDLARCLGFSDLL